MKKVFLVMFALLISGVVVQAQVSSGLTDGHVSPDVRKTTLLVVKYKYEDTSMVRFNDDLVDREEQQRFHEDMNEQLDRLNDQLEKTFSEYMFKVLVIDEEDLKDYNTEDFRFVYNRYLVRRVSKKNPSKGHFTYTHYFKDRSTGKAFEDIEFYSTRKMLAHKVIVRELNVFLAEHEMQQHESQRRGASASAPKSPDHLPRYVREDY